MSLFRFDASLVRFEVSLFSVEPNLLGATGVLTLVLAVGSDPNDVPDQAEPLEDPDHAGADIDLPAAQPVAGGAGKRMVVVMPGLPH